MKIRVIENVLKAPMPRDQKIIVFLAFVVWVGLATLIATSPSKLIFDEGYHLGLAQLISQDGFLEALVSPKNQSAAGPLYAGLHLALGSVTSMNAPGIRWVGYFCLLLISVVLARTSCKTPQGSLSISQASLCLLGIPFLWPCVGIALTEVPGMLFFTLALFCIREFTAAEYSSKTYLWAMLAGFALGFAILGRQTYLIAFPVLGVWGILTRKWLMPTVATISIAMMSCGWIFYIWGGLVPPSQRGVDGGLRFEHALLAMIYIGVAGFILAPSLLIKTSWRLAVLLFFVFTGLGFLMIGMDVVPAKTLMFAIFGNEWGGVVGRLFLSLMFGISIVWLVSLLSQFRLHRDAFQILNLLLLLAFILAPAKISHLFSSRYVVTALIPLIFLTGFENSKFAIFLKSIGAVLGGLSLASYYGWI
jgi:hypothetical protein